MLSSGVRAQDAGLRILIVEKDDTDNAQGIAIFTSNSRTRRDDLSERTTRQRRGSGRRARRHLVASQPADSQRAGDGKATQRKQDF